MADRVCLLRMWAVKNSMKRIPARSPVANKAGTASKPTRVKDRGVVIGIRSWGMGKGSFWAVAAIYPIKGVIRYNYGVKWKAKPEAGKRIAPGGKSERG